MIKLFNALKQSPSLFLFLFYALFAIALLAPLSAEQTIPAITDYVNHIASVIEAKMALTEGQFPLRISPMELSGWRYPNFQFYSPTTYTISGLIYRWLTPDNPITAIKITLWLALVTGGLYMQRLAYWFVKSKPAALFASIIYLTAPYYVIVITGLGNICEAVALGLVPVVVYYSIQHYLRAKNKTLLQTTLVWYFLITIHMITFVYTALFLALLLLLMTMGNKRHWKNLISVAIAFAFGCLLAAWFLAPIALLQKYLIIAQTFTSPNYFQSFGPALSNLLSPNHLYFHGALGSNHIAIGLPILIGVILCCYAYLNQFRISNSRANFWLQPLLILFFLIFLIVWSPIHFLQWVPQALLVGQYSWRLLDQLIWVGALLSAWAVCWLFQNKLELKQIVIGFLLLIITASINFPILNTGYFNFKLDDLIKKPLAIFNPDAYTMEFNIYTGFVNAIDTMQLSSLMTNNVLQFNKIYSLPQTLMHYTQSPKIIINGMIPNATSKQIELTALINHSMIASFHLISGKFHWEIPLTSSVLSRFNNAKILELQFKNNSTKPLSIAISDLELTGFLPKSTTLNIKTVTPFCQQQKTMTVCKIKVPKETQLLELPILFYPKLLHITLNGKTIIYQGIVYKNNLIAGIQPIAGQTNLITIQFTGLVWANIMSWLGWSLWIGLFVYTLFRYLRFSYKK